MRALFKSINLIGDGLYVGPALRAWIKQQKGPVEIWLETLNDHVAPLYYGMVRDFLHGERYHEEARHLKTFAVIHNHPEGKFDFEHTFDVSAAFKLSDQKKQHLATSYADLLGVKIGDEKENLKPVYIPAKEEVEWMEWSEQTLKGCILVSMFSASCSGRDPKCNYIPNKMLPWAKWVPMLEYLRLQFSPETPMRFLGAPSDRRGALGIHDSEWMTGIPLNRLALIMQHAKLLVTIDNGMAHLGASQSVPTFLMYPVALGAHYILPIGNPNLVWLHMNPVTVDKERLLAGLVWATSKFEKTVWRVKCF